MVLRGGIIFEKKILPSVWAFYPCVHSRDFHRPNPSGMASCGDRGRSYHSFRLHDDSDLIRGYLNEGSSNETSEIFTGHNKSNIQNKMRQGIPPVLFFVKFTYKN